MSSGFKYGFESFFDRFYFRVKYIYRQLKKIFIFLIGFIFKTLNIFEILPIILRFFILLLVTVVFYDLSLNLPFYLLKLSVSSFTINFCSGYISVYESILLMCNTFFFYFVTNKYNFYILFLFFLWLFKSFDIFLRLKYDWLISKNLTTCASFEEFQFIENSSLNLNTSIIYTFRTSNSFFKKIYVFSKYFYLFRNYLKLLMNYLIIIFKKISLHFFNFFLDFPVKFGRKYLSHLNTFRLILWKPIFKKWSYFGLFRSYRSKWLNNK